MKDEHIILSVRVYVWHRDCKQNVYSKVTNGLWIVVHLVSGIFKSIKIRYSLELELVSTKFNTKTLCTLIFASNILENIAAYKKIKAWNVINHNNYINSYISCLELCFSQDTFGSLKIRLSDNFVSMREFSTDTKLHKLALQSGILKERFYKKI